MNALLPGGTDAPMGCASAGTLEALAFVQGLHALKRMASPDEIAKSALYLVSDAPWRWTMRELILVRCLVSYQ